MPSAVCGDVARLVLRSERGNATLEHAWLKWAAVQREKHAQIEGLDRVHGFTKHELDLEHDLVGTRPAPSRPRLSFCSRYSQTLDDGSGLGSFRVIETEAGLFLMRRSAWHSIT